MENRRFSFDLGGKELVVTLPNLAEQANGEALIQLGETVVLVTAVMGKSPREGIDFFPLTCEFEERYYAAGEIRTSRFVKRETKPPDEAFLAARAIDRTIRPRFPKGMHNEVQVVATALSYDKENDHDVLGIIGASVALAISDIPWNGPIAAVRVARKEGRLLFNPATTERAGADFEIVVAGTRDRINMLEGSAQEVSEADAEEALAAAQHLVTKLCDLIGDIAQKAGKPKTTVPLSEIPDELKKSAREFLGERLQKTLFMKEAEKAERMAAVNALKKEMIETLGTHEAFTPKLLAAFFEEEIDRIVHEQLLDRGLRPDGRKTDELRDLSAEVGILPRTHGSALFVRGTTKALATATLAAPGEELLVETMEGEWKKRFLLHYNFPPFSVGEVGPFRGPGRREIGHGALAERAVSAVLPSREQFPYMMRVVCEILSSNGSSSMATVCAASLALMDGGVPISRPVAGIAMGMMSDKKGRFAILTDIQGPEDHHGDMDMKIAGTSEGITGLQMDVKIDGITPEMLKQAFVQAKRARLEILEAMARAIDKPRPMVGKYAPKVIALKINQEKIRDVIGPGGRIINTIIAETHAAIDVEDTGDIYVTSVDISGAEKAAEWIRNLTREIMPGEAFNGKVTRFFPFGMMVEIVPDKEGLVHSSELSRFGVRRAEDSFTVGETIPVVVKEIDDQGRVNLAPGEGFRLQEIPGGAPAPGYSDRDRGGRGGYDRGGRGGGRGGRPFFGGQRRH